MLVVIWVKQPEKKQQISQISFIVGLYTTEQKTRKTNALYGGSTNSKGEDKK